MNPLNGKYYTSYSGADITAVVGNQVFATLQALSYSVSREKGPVYTMGSSDPRAFARGKRAIAGTLVFVTVDKSSLYGHFQDMGGDANRFYGNKTDIRYDKLSSSDPNWIDGTSPFSVTDPQLAASGAGSEKVDQEINYSDQILPFDINLSAANEYGQVMKKSFVGVEVLNEGSGVSIDDLVMEEQYTWICRFMTPWVKVTTATRKLNLGSNIAPSTLT